MNKSLIFTGIVLMLIGIWMIVRSSKEPKHSLLIGGLGVFVMGLVYLFVGILTEQSPSW